MTTRTRLLNGYEEITYHKLKAVCDVNGAHVFPKVRIADVFLIRDSGLADGCFTYALKAHFDFLVTNHDYEPLFSVEFDGPRHSSDLDQVSRDKLKYAICDHFQYPILRVNARYLQKEFRGLDLLTYFVEVWFLEKAFDEAQRRGQISYEEPFDACCVYTNGKGQKWPYWVSLDAQACIERMHRAGLLHQRTPSRYVGEDKQGNYRCLAWIRLSPSRVMATKTGMRVQRFSGVWQSDLLGMLAVCDLSERLTEWEHGTCEATHTTDAFLLELEAFQSMYEMRCSSISG